MAELGLQHPDGGDYYAPDVGQRIDAQGRVTYEFTGHVAAEGVDLMATNQTTPAADRRITWKAANGAVVAHLWGYDDGAGQLGAVLRAPDPASPADTVAARLQAGEGLDMAAVEAYDPPAPGLAQVRMFAGAASAIALAEGGQSSFVKLAGGQYGPIELWGGFSGAFSVPVGGSTSVDIAIPNINGWSFVLPVGAPQFAAWVDATSWAYSFPSASTLRIHLRADGAGGVAAGTFFCCVIAIK